MPTGETPSPTVKGLDYGENIRANDLASMFTDEPHDPEADFVPQNDQEAFVYSPTDRPSEPLTAGAPFGEGPDLTKAIVRPDQDFMASVAERIVSDPAAGREAKAFAARVARGL